MTNDNVETLFSLYNIYDRSRDSFLWFLEDFNVKNYQEYKQKYHGTNKDRCQFIRVCGFFELSGTLVKRQLIDPNLYFDVFNPTPFWHKARPVIEGMRQTRPFIYENFERLNQMKMKWSKKRPKS
ncbi:MAG TPA: hypothetical protein VE594_08210 [Nitrososphaeraceae archaeon]|nr:hypothetical protein [Nitrososphaeraceae archaeon]